MHFISAVTNIDIAEIWNHGEIEKMVPVYVDVHRKYDQYLYLIDILLSH